MCRIAIPIARATTAKTTPTVMPTFAPTVRPWDFDEEERGADVGTGEVVAAAGGRGAVEGLATGRIVDGICDGVGFVTAVGNIVELELGSTVVVIGVMSLAKLYPDTKNPVTVIPPSLFSAGPGVCRRARVPDKLFITIADPDGTIDMHLLSAR
jgi:hypothetical protein